MNRFIKYNKGDQLGKVIYLEEVESDNRRKAKFLCHCGKEFVNYIHQIKRGYSCGCLEYVGNHKTHGLTKTVEYKAWAHIKDRCHNPNNKYYSDYGARGIIVCERWRNSFENFLEDMGRRPDNKDSLDRINVNGNYEPDNCKWADQKEQQNNRRNTIYLTYQNQTLTISQWAAKLNKNENTLRTRYKRKQNVESILDYPIL